MERRPFRRPDARPISNIPEEERIQKAIDEVIGKINEVVNTYKLGPSAKLAITAEAMAKVKSDTKAYLEEIKKQQEEIASISSSIDDWDK